MIMDGISLPIDGFILVDVSIQTACLDTYICISLYLDK